MGVRIYQLARQLNLDNKELIAILQKRGLDVKSPSSTIPHIYAEEIVHDYHSKGNPVLSGPDTHADNKEVEQNVAIEPQPASHPLPKTTQKNSPDVQPSLAMGSFVKSAAQVYAERKLLADQKKAVILDTPAQETASGTLPLKPTPSKVMMAPMISPMPTLFKSSAEEAPILEDKVNGACVAEKKQLVIKPPIVVSEFATLLDIKPFRLISELMEMGIFAFMNQAIGEEVAQKIASKYGIEVVFKHRTQVPTSTRGQQPTKAPEEESKLLESRPPIVCILGHVDHGKTTLLDFIRKSNVVAKEAGGITQHVGAYQIEHAGKKITFLDTPGHAAFSKIRQRGATVTDIAILVVAADDGFMPQTDEALSFAQKENVPVVVAINKIDAKGANVDRVKQQMQKRGIASEDWGGETLCVDISALKGTHVTDLLEAVLLQAEMMELKANPRCAAEGVVIESKVEVGKGPTATVIIDKGTLKTGDALVCGDCYCKTRALLNENGDPLKEATPATPVQILGWSDAPSAGANFKVVKNEKEAKREAEAHTRQLKQVQPTEDGGKVTNIGELMAAIESNKQKTLKVMIHADVHGSAEAVTDCLKAIKSDKVVLEIITADVGPISLNDIYLAHAAQATLVGFNTRLETGVLGAAKHHQVRIVQHNIIYELVQQVTDLMRELLDPEWVESKLGSAEVRQVFPLAKGQVAGCMVVAGRVVRDASARLMRNNKVIAETKIQMLKRFKEDVTEVKSGYECGIQLHDAPASYMEGDSIECFEMVAKLASL
ncbi:MAG: translation initiation factor IF-2 [Puniceicoccales bacterium]|jgi:translation initiation factor IF-2|nr:translation initiation factor IF-2 [Puniceicoccales bacterium]